MDGRARRSAEVRAELNRLRPFEEVARTVIRLRMEHNLSQEALAQRVGTTKSAISRLESGRHAPNLATLDRIAAAFGGRVVIGFDVASPPKDGKPARALVASGRAS
jgi:transcriptional regulator with XRE-family HTH domain